MALAGFALLSHFVCLAKTLAYIPKARHLFGHSLGWPPRFQLSKYWYWSWSWESWADIDPFRPHVCQWWDPDFKEYTSTLNYTAALCRIRSKAQSLTARKRQEQILSYPLASRGRGCIRHTRAISFPSLSLCINLKIEIIQMAEMSPPAAVPERQGLVNHIKAIQSSS